MKAGELRHRITIQQPTDARGASGGVTKGWSVLAVVWANVQPMSGRELRGLSAEAVSELTHTVCIRHRSDVTTEMRIAWQSRTFDIESIINVNEADEETQLMCREVTDA